jgi:hypothetical protein
MIIGNNKLSGWLGIALISFLAIGHAELFAEEPKAKTTTPDISNIGFIQNPPTALRERFPMCDAFLNVEWIDKEKAIGYSHYEAIVKNKKNQFKGEKKQVWALVNMKGPHGIDYDVYEYQRSGRLKELFQKVREGEVSVGIPMMIRYKKERINLYGGKTLNYGAIHPLLSDHRQTVCVPYPDEQWVWIIEGKSVGQFYGEAQIAGLSERMDELSGKRVPRSRIEALWLLDVNWDGKSDYLFEGSLVYSVSNRLYMSSRTYEHPYFKYTFPPGSGVCRVQGILPYLLTTDGKSYYRDGCNLTELTAQLGKE